MELSKASMCPEIEYLFMSRIYAMFLLRLPKCIPSTNNRLSSEAPVNIFETCPSLSALLGPDPKDYESYVMHLHRKDKFDIWVKSLVTVTYASVSLLVSALGSTIWTWLLSTFTGSGKENCGNFTSADRPLLDWGPWQDLGIILFRAAL